MHDIAAVTADLAVFHLGASEPEAMARSMRVLEAFNQCALGVIRFAGATEWERHPDDEFLYVVAGEVEVTLLVGEERRQALLRPGCACVVPAGAWHRQHTPDGVTLIYITSREGTDHASAAGEPPRLADSSDLGGAVAAHDGARRRRPVAGPPLPYQTNPGASGA